MYCPGRESRIELLGYRPLYKSVSDVVSTFVSDVVSTPSAEPYHHLPSFYSDLFDLGYEAVGELDARLETLADWKEPNREGVIYYLWNGRVRGVLLWNVWERVDAARALIAEPGPFAAKDLKGRIA